MKDITLETKIAELLNDYDGMKDILIDINPKFKKLNNPVLKRTLAKVAGVKQAAIVGGMEPLDLLNKLRKAVGQPPVDAKVNEEKKHNEPEPDWIRTNSKANFDANALLDKEDNPLAHSFNILRELKDGEVITITSDFQPEPLIEEFEKKGHEVYCESIDNNNFITYIKK